MPSQSPETDKKRGFAYVPVVLNFLPEKYYERLLIQKHYLDNEDRMMIEEHKRLFPTKDKSVIKFKKK